MVNLVVTWSSIQYYSVLFSNGRDELNLFELILKVQSGLSAPLAVLALLSQLVKLSSFKTFLSHLFYCREVSASLPIRSNASFYRFTAFVHKISNYDPVTALTFILDVIKKFSPRSVRSFPRVLKYILKM